MASRRCAPRSGEGAVWIGRTDHLDVVGYVGASQGAGGWLPSDASFDPGSFATMMDRIVEDMWAREMESVRPIPLGSFTSLVSRSG